MQLTFFETDHSFSTDAKFSEKLIFHTPWQAHVQWKEMNEKMIDMKPKLTRALLVPLNHPFPIKLTKLFFQLSLCQQHILFFAFLCSRTFFRNRPCRGCFLVRFFFFYRVIYILSSWKYDSVLSLCNKSLYIFLLLLYIVTYSKV